MNLFTKFTNLFTRTSMVTGQEFVPNLPEWRDCDCDDCVEQFG